MFVTLVGIGFGLLLLDSNPRQLYLLSRTTCISFEFPSSQSLQFWMPSLLSQRQLGVVRGGADGLEEYPDHQKRLTPIERSTDLS
jgi:hypothetical protein